MARMHSTHPAPSPLKTQSASLVKETAADFARRELDEIIQRMEVVSNRLSSARKRLQAHFGVSVQDQATACPPEPVSPGMDGVRHQLDKIDSRLHAIADEMEELI